jgi:hypothetical protein
MNMSMKDQYDWSTKAAAENPGISNLVGEVDLWSLGPNRRSLNGHPRILGGLTGLLERRVTSHESF